MLERAKEFLQVAELAMEKGLHNGCAANCYYAFLWAANLAMKHAGFKQQKWSHGIKSKFQRRTYPQTAYLSAQICEMVVRCS